MFRKNITIKVLLKYSVINKEMTWQSGEKQLDSRKMTPRLVDFDEKSVWNVPSESFLFQWYFSVERSRPTK